jgi:hypothetical protein
MLTLTIAEIKDLAECAGFILDRGCKPDLASMATEISILQCPPEGVIDDNGLVTRHRYVAFFAEYPEEGCYPLGDALP